MESKGAFSRPFPSTSFIPLASAWAIVTFHLIVLGCTVDFTLEAILKSFHTYAMAFAFTLYIWFFAPLVVAWTSFFFLKSALAKGPTARLGLVASIGVLLLWIVMLAYQFGIDRWCP